MACPARPLAARAGRAAAKDRAKKFNLRRRPAQINGESFPLSGAFLPFFAAPAFGASESSLSGVEAPPRATRVSTRRGYFRYAY